MNSITFVLSILSSNVKTKNHEKRIEADQRNLPLFLFCVGLIAVISIWGTSCSKTDHDSSSAMKQISTYAKSDVTARKIETILSSANSQFQRQSFASLPNNEKVEFLKSYLALHLEDFRGQAAKIDFINNLISEIDDNFVGPNGKTRVVTADYKAKSIFTKDEYVNLFYKVSNPQSLNVQTKSPLAATSVGSVSEGEELLDCNCGVNAVSACNFG